MFRKQQCPRHWGSHSEVWALPLPSRNLLTWQVAERGKRMYINYNARSKFQMPRVKYQVPEEFKEEELSSCFWKGERCGISHKLTTYSSWVSVNKAPLDSGRQGLWLQGQKPRLMTQAHLVVSIGFLTNTHIEGHILNIGQISLLNGTKALCVS